MTTDGANANREERAMSGPTATRSPAGTCWSCGEPAPMHRTGCTLADPASWESDHQRRILEWLDAEHGTALAAEFPFGCDTIQHVAEALIALRAERPPILDMWLCEQERLALKVGVLYRFTAKPGCARCEEIDRLNRQVGPDLRRALTEEES